MSAAAVLAEAWRAGVSLRLVDGKARVRGTIALDLLERLRDHKVDIIEILSGDRCRTCGEHLPWPAPAGVIFADGTAECMACADREVGRLLAAGERSVASPDALADEAEIMLRGDC